MAALNQARLDANSPPDSTALVRETKRLKADGFRLTVRDSRLRVSPIDRLSSEQRAFLAAHKPALVQLLTDAETLYSALLAAGVAGLAWREGTPTNWPDVRLLAAGELLYSDDRMINQNGRRYAVEPRP